MVVTVYLKDVLKTHTLHTIYKHILHTVIPLVTENNLLCITDFCKFA